MRLGPRRGAQCWGCLVCMRQRSWLAGGKGAYPTVVSAVSRPAVATRPYSGRLWRIGLRRGETARTTGRFSAPSCICWSESGSGSISSKSCVPARDGVLSRLACGEKGKGRRREVKGLIEVHSGAGTKEEVQEGPKRRRWVQDAAGVPACARRAWPHRHEGCRGRRCQVVTAQRWSRRSHTRAQAQRPSPPQPAEERAETLNGAAVGPCPRRDSNCDACHSALLHCAPDVRLAR